jgi:hypothetical protein
MRLLAALALACVLSLGVATPAFADGSGDGWLDPGGDINAGAGDDGSSPGGGTGGGGSSSGCTYTPVTQELSDIADRLADNGWGNPGGDGEGAWYRKICPDGTGTMVWIPAGGVDPAVLAEQAFDRTQIPLPGVHLNPPDGTDQIVNVPTWMWVDNFSAVSASASAGGVTVTVTARPVRVDWSMGNGDSVSCSDGGTPYDNGRTPESQQSDCTYTYRRSSATRSSGTFTIRATTRWHATWAATGVNASGDLGFIGRSTDIVVRVGEIQTVHE